MHLQWEEARSSMLSQHIYFGEVDLESEGGHTNRKEWKSAPPRVMTCVSPLCLKGYRKRVKKRWKEPWEACEHPHCCYIRMPSGFRQTVCWAPSAGAQKLLHSSSSFYCWQQRPSSQSQQLLNEPIPATSHVPPASVSSSFYQLYWKHRVAPVHPHKLSFL